jgi:hypothetical protein
MDKYECLACGYIYDPAKGDPESDVPPGTLRAILREGGLTEADLRRLLGG